MSSADPTRGAFLRGIRAGAPFVVVIVPFAMLFGVVGTEAGLNIAEVLAFSVLVIAGASQFAAVQLMTENAPVLIVLATSLAVNLRMAMYSAALTPYLGGARGWTRALLAYFLVDQNYAAAAVEFENRPRMTLSERVAFFIGTMVPICPLWYGATWFGAVIGNRIPPEYALDFALPITFIAMMAPMLRTPAHVAAAFVSVALALALAWMPYGTGLLVAAAAAMVTGAAVETLQERKARA